MQELFLYDKAQGLFKNILKASSVMKGSYHVSPNAGNDLNTANLETWVKDPANGLVDQKGYPICVCMTPLSRVIVQNGTDFEQFTFNLFFVTTTGRNSDGTTKMRDKDTGTSAHPVWYDWQDMKSCAMNFIWILKAVLKTRSFTDNSQQIPLRSVFDFDERSAIYRRLSRFNNDVLTGVSVAFNITMASVLCNTDEYGSDLSVVDIPSPTIHVDE